MNGMACPFSCSFPPVAVESLILLILCLPFPAAFANGRALPRSSQRRSRLYATLHLQILLNQILAFSDRLHLVRKAGICMATQVAEPLLPGLTALRNWSFAWDRAVDRMNSIINGGNGKQHKAFLLVKIYQSALKVVFASFDNNLPESESFELELMGILELCGAFLPSHNGWRPPGMFRDTDESSNPLPVFSVALGVVPILFEMAHRAENPRIREEGLRLLRSCNRREGIWDS